MICRKLGLDLLPKSETGDFLQVNTTSCIQLFKTVSHLFTHNNHMFIIVLLAFTHQ